VQDERWYALPHTQGMIDWSDGRDNTVATLVRLEGEYIIMGSPKLRRRSLRS
jgi:hypothetical protein